MIIMNAYDRSEKMNFGQEITNHNQYGEEDEEEDDDDSEEEDEEEDMNEQSHSATYRHVYGSGFGTGHISNGIDNLIASAPLLLSTSDTNWTTSPYYAMLQSNGQASIPFQSMAMGMQSNNSSMCDIADLNIYASHSHAHYPLSHYPTSSYHQPPPPPTCRKITIQ